jgi:muconolactone delta-isomerase
MGLIDTLTRALAYHEAGHQVVANALGVPVRGVDIANSGGRAYDGLRFTQYVPETMSAAEWTRFRAKALILMAREAAERALYEQEGDSIPLALWSGPDREEMWAHLNQVFGNLPTYEYAPDQVLKAADAMVLQRWSQVVRVAHALLERKSLRGSDVIALLQPAGIVWEEDQ